MGPGLLATSPKQFPKSQRLRGYSRWPYPSFYKSIFEAIVDIPKIRDGIRGSRSADPPKLTSRGLSMNVPVRRKAANEHQICPTCTCSPSDIQFLCLNLEPVKQASDTQCADLVHPAPFYTVARTGVLEFQSQTGLGDQLFESSRIYLVPSPESSAIQSNNLLYGPYCMVAPCSCVTLQLSEDCTVVDSHIFWHKEKSSQTASNFFNLGPLTTSEIGAVFAIGCAPSPETNAKLCIAFGLGNWHVPWCDALLQPSTHDSTIFDVSSTEDARDSADEYLMEVDIAQYQGAAEKLVPDPKLFASPLSAAFSDVNQIAVTILRWSRPASRCSKRRQPELRCGSRALEWPFQRNVLPTR